LQWPTTLTGTDTLDVDAEGALFVDVVADAEDDDVVEKDVVVDDVVEFGVVVDPFDITNPQPCDGSFSVSGSETRDGDVVEDVGDDVAVVVVRSVEVPVDLVLVVVDEMVVGGADELFVDHSRLEPTSTRARSTTERTIRTRQRRWGSGSEEFRICSSP
jgi:hypothetical protein